MAFTAADRETLKAAIARGEQTVAFADRTVTYRSVSEMLRALQVIEADLATQATTPRPRYYKAYAKKGL